MRDSISTIMIALMLVTAAGDALAKKKPAEVSSSVEQLTERIAVDPLLVTALTLEDPAGAFNGLVDMLERFGGEEFDRGELLGEMAEFDREVGCSLVGDLLAGMGPAMALVIDLPPIDSIAGAMANPEVGIPQFLAGIGLLAQVRDATAVDGCLRKLWAHSGAAVEDVPGAPGLVRLGIPMNPGEPGSQGPDLGLFYGIHNGVIALGASSELVEASLVGREEGERLSDGSDYAGLFQHLDPQPTGLTYVNLPKLAELIRESAMAQGMLATQADAKPLADFFLGSDMAKSGLGSTTIEIDGRTRSTSIGPPGLSGGVASTGIVAAIAIPNLLNAIDRGKQKRTMADLRVIATAVEGYSNDHNAYPTIGEGWQPVANLADTVSPTYIRRLPAVDGWGQPILYWSNGETYRIVSGGKGGQIDGAWSEKIEPHSTTAFTDDIVFADGSFVVWPEGPQE